ncbi:MAG: complex I subunit 5 family protein [Acidiphilium sp.]
MNPAIMPPLPVAGPLAVAGLLLVFSRALPKYVPDILALLTTVAATVICLLMAKASAAHPLVYWFGGWVPRPGGLVLGIGFVVDQAGAAMSAFIGLLFTLTLVFAWGWFDEVHAHFHVLMLLFMGGMIGFCLTHDLFDLFVWFEVMSVAGFALTGYSLRASALDGALNFTVVNTLGSYMILGGIGLIYSKVGALDFSALERGVAAAPSNPVVTAAFALLATGLLVKAAQVPFQFWLSDAHTVAPSPVSVIFSGAMVAIGLFGLARLIWSIFMPSAEIRFVVHTLLLGMGVASAVIGGVMALIQRHIKRLLAFSTISHVGILLIALALLNRAGLAGMLVYLVGHGLVKGALFMVAGILLAMRGGIDEIGLRGMGRGIWPAGIAMAAGGLLLAGMPIGLMDQGVQLLDHAAHQSGEAWTMLAVLAASACTGGAVLRVTGRVFLGLGAMPGEEERSPTEEEQEKANRPLWLMLLPTALLLLFALVGADAAGRFAARIAGAFMHPQNRAILGLAQLHRPIGGVMPPLPSSWIPWISLLLAVAIAAFDLGRGHLPPRLIEIMDRVLRRPLGGLREVHSGLISDYVAWLAVGLALFAVAFALS